MSLTDLSRKINYDISTLSEIKNDKVKPSGKVYLSLLSLCKMSPNINTLNLISRNGKEILLLKDYISPQLLGLIHSDGTLSVKKGANLEFHNKNQKIIKTFKKLLKNTFICEIYEKIDERDGTITIRVPSVIARILINKFGEKNDKKPIEMKQKEVEKYIRGLFDGDGSLSIYYPKKCNSIIPCLKITTSNRNDSKRIQKLLLKLGIRSKIRFNRNKRGHEWYSVVMNKQGDVKKFIQKIGSSHPKKIRKMKEFISFINN